MRCIPSVRTLQYPRSAGHRYNLCLVPAVMKTGRSGELIAASLDFAVTLPTPQEERSL